MKLFTFTLATLLLTLWVGVGAPLPVGAPTTKLQQATHLPTYVAFTLLSKAHPLQSPDTQTPKSTDPEESDSPKEEESKERDELEEFSTLAAVQWLYLVCTPKLACHFDITSHYNGFIPGRFSPPPEFFTA